MDCVVCTLVEGHYHFGVAALINSLYKNGFKGDCYAGYKGELPFWASAATENNELGWKDAKTLVIEKDLRIHFLPLSNDFHLTNYKPNFMLDLWNGPAKDADGILYFDPDIVVKINWRYFEKWISYGVALVHEVTSNDMPPNHPKRHAWKEVILKAGMNVENNLHSYINGGFCGLIKDHIAFLDIWKDVFQTGVKYFGLSNDQWGHDYTPDYIFFAQDQDALNIAAMCSTVPISEMGPEAMDFVNGGWVMSHCVGGPKPWKKNILTEFFKGKNPGVTDRLYWDHVNYPIKPYVDSFIKRKKILIKVTSLLSRFYKR